MVVSSYAYRVVTLFKFYVTDVRPDHTSKKNFALIRKRGFQYLRFVAFQMVSPLSLAIFLVNVQYIQNVLLFIVMPIKQPNNWYFLMMFWYIINKIFLHIFSERFMIWDCIFFGWIITGFFLSHIENICTDTLQGLFFVCSRFWF